MIQPSALASPIKETERFRAYKELRTMCREIRLIRTYKRDLLKTDLVAAVTVFAILVPSALAYGELAGFEPVVGLYAALVGMIAYALFGSSRHLIIGPEATTAILVATVVAPLAGGDIARYAYLAAALAILIGVICILAGKFRMGFVANFFSKPILAGYITGTALIVMSSQLGKIFGISLESDGFFAKIWELIISLDETHLLTLAVGLVTILGLILLKRFTPKIPGTLVALVVAIIVSSYYNLAEYGVARSWPGCERPSRTAGTHRKPDRHCNASPCSACPECSHLCGWGSDIPGICKEKSL